MAISSVTSSETAQLAATYAKSQAERIERVENDGDSDDKSRSGAACKGADINGQCQWPDHRLGCKYKSLAAIQIAGLRDP